MVEVEEATSTSDATGPGEPERRRTTSWWTIVGAVFVVLLGAFCFVVGADDRALRDSLVERRFVVSSITEGGRPKVLVGPAASGEPAVGSIRFGIEYVSASGGCNSTTRGFGVGDGRLNVSIDGSMTTAACSQETMDQDLWLDGVLLAEPAIALDGERLTLTTASTTVELVERAEPPNPPPPAPPPVLEPADLTGRTFVATAALVDGVERRIVGTADEPEPHRLRLTFGDGTVTATAGCSSGTGPYSLGMQRIEGLTMTPSADCPPDLVDQDAWLNDLFSTPPSIGVDGDYLTLGNQVDTIMVFVDEAAETPVVAPSPLAGTTWSLEPSASRLEPTTSTAGFGATLVLGDGTAPEAYLRDGCTIVTGAVDVEAASATSGAITMHDLERIDAPCAASSRPIVDVMTAIQTGTWSYAIDIDRLELRQGDRTVTFRTN